MQGNKSCLSSGTGERWICGLVSGRKGKDRTSVVTSQAAAVL